MNSETLLILSAMKRSTPDKIKKKLLQELEPDILCPAPDAIIDIVNKKVKKKKENARLKKKSITQWTNTDFIRYANSLLSVHDVRFESSAARDSQIIARVYDDLVKRLGEQMNNQILKDYIEWWATTHGPALHGEPLYVSVLLSVHLLDKFQNRFTTLPKTQEVNKIEPATTQVDPKGLYAMGGISMVLLSHGIVHAYRVLKEDAGDKVFDRIVDALRSLSKESVKKTLEQTLRLAPYNGAAVDFVSLARSAIEFYNLKEYKKLRYADYFAK